MIESFGRAPSSTSRRLTNTIAAQFLFQRAESAGRET
jgi:hypothetical protein